MATPVWITGFEYGLATPNTLGGGLANITNDIGEVQSTTKRSGSYAFRCYATGTAVNKNMGKTINSGVVVFRCYFMVHTWPDQTTNILGFQNTDADGMFFINASTHVLYATFIGVQNQNGPTLSLDTWYRLECRIVTNSTTHTLDWQVAEGDGDATAYTQVNITGRASVDMTNVIIGWYNQAVTSEIFFDDVFMSVTSGDYPIGPGRVEGLWLTGDGTHNAGTNVMEDDHGNDIGAVTAWEQLDTVPLGDGTAPYVRQFAAGNDYYAECTFANTTLGTVNGVVCLLARMASANDAVNAAAAVVVRSDATEVGVFGTKASPVNYSTQYSLWMSYYTMAVVTAPGSGWTPTEVNALKARMGYATDVDPMPWWRGFLLEVDGTDEAGDLAVGAHVSTTMIGSW